MVTLVVLFGWGRGWKGEGGVVAVAMGGGGGVVVAAVVRSLGAVVVVMTVATTVGFNAGHLDADECLL